MNRAEGFGEFKGKGVRAGLTDDCIWPQELLGKFLRRSGSPEEFGLNKDLIADFEVGGRDSAPVSTDLVTFLGFGYLGFEFSVEFVKVHREFSRPGRRQFLLGMDCDIGVVAFVGKEGGDTGGSARCIVVGEFCQRKKSRPVILLIVTIMSQVLFQGLVCTFSLPITLWMVA